MEFLTLPEAAVRLGISRSGVYRYVERGTLTATDGPHGKVVASEEVERVREHVTTGRCEGIPGHIEAHDFPIDRSKGGQGEVRWCPAHRKAGYYAHGRATTVARYGISERDYWQMVADQGNRCAICHKDPGKQGFQIDHDHQCCPGRDSCGKCVRGLLCSPCNMAIGLLGDNTVAIRRALEYVGGEG